MALRDSWTDPIRVAFVPEDSGDRPGRLGLTFAPGKRAPAQFMGGTWARDLDVDLQRLIERLGRVFEALHRSSVQSEPEQNHFKLKGEVSERSEKVLRVAYQAAALRRLDENKQKSLADVRGDVWQLHPRFAPMFSISWRRKKQLVLDAADFEQILWGEDSVWARWLALFQQRQRTEPDGDDPQMRMALEPSAGD